MNRIITIVLALTLLLFTMVMTSCEFFQQTEPIEPPHVHEYAISDQVAPNCTEGGYTTYLCECGDTYTESFLPNGHDYNTKVVKPTCTSEGYSEHTCKVCGDYKQDTITAVNPNGHNMVEVDSKEPNCTEYGYTKSVCEYCEVKLEVVLEPKHTYGSWEVFAAPTCTEEGINRRYCTNPECDKHEDKAIKPNGHDYNPDLTTVVEPTCESEGYTSIVCGVCNYEEKTKIQDKLPHTYVLINGEEWQLTTLPNCVEYGVETRVCGECGYSETRRTTSTHVLEYTITEPTCTVQGYRTGICMVCGFTEVDQYTNPQHTMGEWEIFITPTCETVGFEHSVCQFCSYEEDRVIAPRHNYFETIVVDPTEFVSGYTIHRCDCGAEFRDTFVSTVGSLGLTYIVRDIWYPELGVYVAEASVTGLGTYDGTVVVLPSEYSGCTVTKVSALAFYAEKDITTLYLSTSIVEFEAAAFWHCSSLVEINYEGTMEQWNAIDKGDDWDKGMAENYVINCSDGTITK